jgi:hypothetical protein
MRARWAIVVGLIASGCTSSNTQAPQKDFSTGGLVDLSTGGFDLSTGESDLSTGGSDLSTSVKDSSTGANDLPGVDLAVGGGDLSTTADLSGLDLSLPTSDLSGADLSTTSSGSDLATSDLSTLGDMTRVGCLAPTTAQPTIGYTVATFSSNSALTFAIPAGYHARGDITLPTLPAGASLDAADCFAIFFDASGAQFTGTITARGPNSVSYDAVLPANTYSFNWGFTVKYAGSAFLGRQDVITNVTICGDHTLNVTVPSFGDVTVATVNVASLNNFGTSPSGALDAIVEMHDAAQLYFAEGSQLNIPSATTTASINMPLPTSVAMTPYVLGRVTGFDTTPGAGYFQTRVAFVPGTAGQTTYTLTLPTLAQLSGSINASSDIDTGHYVAFSCSSPAADNYYEFSTIYYTSTFSTPYRSGGTCLPYSAVPVTVSTTAVNENPDGLLDFADPTTETQLNVVAGTNTIPAVTVPALAGVPVLVLGTLTDGSGAPLAGYTVSARSAVLQPAALGSDRFRLEGGVPFGALTDASGNFKLHLIPGLYSLVANP